MNQTLTQAEKRKIQQLCFSNPSKSCAIVQEFIDALQLVGCNTFAELTGKSKRTINYQSEKLTGIKVEGRKYIVFPQ
jgi:hypothetical protein